jgi:homogentisate 1,2-dioxygenase
VRSSLEHSEYTLLFPSTTNSNLTLTPNALKWNDFNMEEGNDWVSGQKVVAQAGDIPTKTGLGYLVYAATKDMKENTVFFSSDGDLLVVPQAGTLDIHTELGDLLVR